MLMKSGSALVLAVASLALLNGCTTSNPSTATGIVWVATSGDQKINTYAINSTSGAGSRIGSGIDSGAQPSAMVMTADGKLLFVANIDDNCGSASFCNQVREFSVKSDGTLTAVGSPVQITTPTSTAQGMRMGLAVDPTGKLLFVANEGNSGVLGQLGTVPGTVSIFNVSSSSAPAAVTNSPFSSALPGDITGNGPSAVAVSPVANFVYVANQFSNTVGAFSYDATAGALTPIGGYSTGSNPSALAFSRCAGGKALNSSCAASDNNTLFVANSGASNSISEFPACIEVSATCAIADGTLQSAGARQISAFGTGPSSIIVSPQINFVYVVDTQSNQVSQFSYSPATGALSPLTPATISTGSNPVSGGITLDGAFVVVPDSGGSDLTVFSVNNTTSTGVAPTGKLSRATSSTVTLAGQPTAVLVR
jgi:6-phosphogluconolactonase (cycloisomerase 2 family)